MAGKFDLGTILRAAGEPAASGGKTADAAMIEMATILDPWCTSVGGGDRELIDDATGTYLAIHRGSLPEAIRVSDGVNGNQILDLKPQVPYDEAMWLAIAELLSYAKAIARESEAAAAGARPLVDDFQATCQEMGFSPVREPHNYGGGFTVYFPHEALEGFPEDLRPEVDYNGMNCPSVSVRDHHESGKDNLFLAKLATSDAAVSLGRVKGRLEDLLVRLAATARPQR